MLILDTVIGYIGAMLIGIGIWEGIRATVGYYVRSKYEIRMEGYGYAIYYRGKFFERCNSMLSAEQRLRQLTGYE